MSYHRLLFHVVFATKQRRPCLQPECIANLGRYLTGVAEALNARILCEGGIAEHIHLLLATAPDRPLSEIIGKLKANSSRWLAKQLGRQNWFGWQDGYSAFTVSASLASRVSRYIQRQPEHHAHRDYRAELIALLEKHDVDYDPRYIVS